jgi:hypothetical protein
LDHVGQFFTGNWGFTEGSVKIPRENSVLHPNMVGVCMDAESSDTSTYKSVTELASWFRGDMQISRVQSAPAWLDFNLRSAASFEESPMLYLNYKPHRDILDSYSELTGTSGEFKMSNITWDLGFNTLTHSYDAYRRLDLTNGDKIHCEYKVKAIWLPGEFSLPVFTWNWIGHCWRPELHVYWEFEPHRYETSGGQNSRWIDVIQGFVPPILEELSDEIHLTGYPDGYALDSFEPTTSVLNYVGQPLDVVEAGLTASLDARASDTGFAAFKNQCMSLRNDAHMLGIKAGHAALDKHFQATSSNFLETVSDGRDLFGLMSVKELTQFAIKASKRGGFLQLLDLLSSSVLLYKFAIAPSIDDAEQLASLAARLKKSVKALQTPATVYGSFEYEVPVAFCPNFPGLRIVSRAKIRLGVDHSSLIGSMLQGKTAGILPSFSQVWDLLPFSFVADWFTGIGNYLDMFDSSLIYMGLAVEYTVISHKFIWEFPDDVGFHHYAVGDSDMLGAGYKVFNRYVLDGLPNLTPTRFPIFGSGIPSWVTAGSLAFQVLKPGK